MFLKNSWYVAAWDREFGDRPLGRTLLNEPVVLFRDAAGKVAALRYISGSGGEPAGQECALKNGDAAELARQAHDGLARLVAAFDSEATPYRALRRARFKYRFDDYAHLARVAEWSAEIEEEAA